jgi:hypothetical protein
VRLFLAFVKVKRGRRNLLFRFSIASVSLGTGQGEGASPHTAIGLDRIASMRSGNLMMIDDAQLLLLGFFNLKSLSIIEVSAPAND